MILNFIDKGLNSINSILWVSIYAALKFENWATYRDSASTIGLWWLQIWRRVIESTEYEKGDTWEKCWQKEQQETKAWEKNNMLIGDCSIMRRSKARGKKFRLTQTKSRIKHKMTSSKLRNKLFYYSCLYL